MKIVRYIFNSIVVVSLICSIYYYISNNGVEIEVEQRKCYVLNDVTDYVIYEQISDNIIKCDISGVSNVINNMLDDNWSLTKFDVDDEYIDVIFERDNVVCRIYYEDDGVLTLIATPYEKSKELVSYMYDKDVG